NMRGSPYGGGYGAPKDAYLFTGAMHNVGENSIVSSSGFDIGGSSRGMQQDDKESDEMVRGEDNDDMDDA
ncbi:hypothetical protein Tco_0980317, partial [Tanacetum coccineum]